MMIECKDYYTDDGEQVEAWTLYDEDMQPVAFTAYIWKC